MDLELTFDEISIEYGIISSMIFKDFDRGEIKSNKIAVIFILYNQQTNKILIEQRMPDQIFAGKKLIPGGSMEITDNNNLETTLKREISEELGVTPTKYLNLEYPIIGETGAILCPFLITEWDGDIPEKIIDKGNTLEWVDYDLWEPELKSVKEILGRATNFIKNNLMSHNLDILL